MPATHRPVKNFDHLCRAPKNSPGPQTHSVFKICRRVHQAILVEPRDALDRDAPQDQPNARRINVTAVGPGAHARSYTYLAIQSSPHRPLHLLPNLPR